MFGAMKRSIKFVVRSSFRDELAVKYIFSIWERRTFGTSNRRFDKLYRMTMGKRTWVDMTQEERFIEFKAAIRSDLRVSLSEVRNGKKDVVDYFLDRALDPLDPFAGVYQTFLQAMGAKISYGGGELKRICLSGGQLCVSNLLNV